MAVEKVVVILIIAAVILLFIILGIVFHKGKGSSLIAGYNTLPPEEKKKYESAALGKTIGKMMFALAGSMFLWIWSVAYDVEWLIGLGIVLFIAIVLFTIVYINKGNKFKKTE